MKVVIIGSGLMGSAAAKYLVARSEIENVLLVDKDNAKLEQETRSTKSKKLVPRLVDAFDIPRVAEVFKGYDAALIALPHAASLLADQAAIVAGVNAVDLSFEDLQMKLHSDCLKADITLIPGCGVAPGIAQVLAGEAARRLSSVEEIHILAGGLPRVPRRPLNYRIVFSLEQLLAMYANKRVRVVKDGKIETVKALSGVERVSFPHPYDHMEAFLTDGLGTLLYTMKRGVKVMEEKTIRYPGHAAQIKTLMELGLISTKSVDVNGTKVVPRKFLSDIVGPRLFLGNGQDVTLLRVVVGGKKNGSDIKYQYEMVDYYDEVEHTTSMARTTAYTSAITAMMLAEGQITAKGIVPPESAFAGSNFNTLLQRLAKKNVKFSSTVTAGVNDMSDS